MKVALETCGKDSKTPPSRKTNADAAMADELNTFYARFEAAANSANDSISVNNCMQTTNAISENTFIISEHDVAFRRGWHFVNVY